MSETSQRSSVDSVNEVLKTFMSVSFSEPTSEIRRRVGQRGRAKANRYSKGTFTGLSNLDVQAVFGSNRSRKPSPSRFKPSTVSAMAAPGNTANQGFSDRKFWASFSMSPQEG